MGRIIETGALAVHEFFMQGKRGAVSQNGSYVIRNGFSPGSVLYTPPDGWEWLGLPCTYEYPQETRFLSRGQAVDAIKENKNIELRRKNMSDWYKLSPEQWNDWDFFSADGENWEYRAVEQ